MKPPMTPAFSTVTLRRSRPLLWCAGIVLALGNTLAAAQSTPPAEEPDTLILSDTLHYDDIKRESIFVGNVTMTRGNLTLSSDRLAMREDADGFQFGTATVEQADRVHLRQEKPEKFENIKAESLRAEYDGKAKQLILIGQAVVTRYVCGQPQDNIRGERIVYHQDTDTYEAFGGPQSAGPNQRVRSVTRHRSKSDAALADCTRRSPTAASATAKP